MESTYTVTGMTCAHCVASVSEEVGAVEGVSDVAVDLPTGTVTVTSERAPEAARIRAAVEEAGYTFAG
ncbi:heavy-metal-associated domain-containing protein [Amycolatopsis sp. FBCC-B4732]|uniref:heavy-metal-associated domain-containing protein n=1 Tax=Amycolatopsis sp. FBCC-B4732 TaxID=3079339 RepID=UPI001FF3609B|nr:heavy metal-associated domain-containing protein [Amycolatopsis sp. FBCC-B4732]UOX90948.1 heavy-metal-associated domain-containing protein [Amycolatopsis sp. FBCC-B4732]